MERTRVSLVACLQTTQSGAATFLGLASDGNTYWIKAPNNPQGSRSLVPERIVTRIGIELGAPVRPIALIDIPSTLDFSFAPGLRLRPGIAHGSLDLGASKVLDDWRGVASRDSNHTRIAGIAALWDLCMGNDPQWLSEFADDSALWSFDHGFWFAGEVDWSVESMRIVGERPWIAPNLDTASSKALFETARKLESLTTEDFDLIAQDVPEEWGASQNELSEVGRILHARVPGVVERLRESAELSNIP